MVCCFLVHFDWCIVSPLRAQKLILTEFENFGGSHTMHCLITAGNLACDIGVLYSVLFCAKFKRNWCIVLPLLGLKQKSGPNWIKWGLLYLTSVRENGAGE